MSATHSANFRFTLVILGTQVHSDSLHFALWLLLDHVVRSFLFSHAAKFTELEPCLEVCNHNNLMGKL